MPEQSFQAISVTLPSDLVQYIQDEALRRKVTPADVIQQAIVNDQYLRQQQLSGSSVLLEKDKSFSKLTL